MINLILCRTAILKNTDFCRVPSMAASEKPCATVWRQKSVFQMHFSFLWMCWKSVKSKIFSVHLYSSRQLRASESRATPLVNIYYKLDFEVEHDENAIGVYLWGKEGRESGLVGYLPIEISKLMKQFLDADKNNPVMATVVGKRKREVGLVIPAKYSAMTANQEIITVLNNELLKRKEKCKHFKMKFESVNNYKKKAVFN